MKQRLLAAGFLLSLGLGSLAADGLKMGGYSIDTVYLGVQTYRTTNNVVDNSGVSVNDGPWWLLEEVGARTQINFTYDSQDVSFATSFRLDEDLLTSSSTLASINPLNTANITFKLLDNQLKIRSGLYQEEGLGYDMQAYATGVMGRYLASSHGGGTDSVYLTSVEYDPDEVPGLGVLLGVPIAPDNLVYPNATASNADQADWASNIYKRFRLAAKWDLSGVGLLRAYWFNALYGNTTSATTAGFAINNPYTGMNEYFLGIENLAFLEGQWKFGLLIDNEQGATQGALEGTATISSRFTPVPGLTIMADDQLSAFNKDWATNTCTYVDGAVTTYATSAEWSPTKVGLLNKIQVNTTYDMKPIQYGLIASYILEPFSNSHYYLWGQPSAQLVNSDVGQGSEWVAVANPYIKLAVGQGTVQLGLIEMYDAKSVSGLTNSAYSWEVPLDFFVWF